MHALDVRNVSVAFGGNLALDRVDLAVAEGQIHGIIGPNGAGKTTLLNVITGISQPDSGDILLHGASIAGLKASRIAASGIRRTFQTSLLCKGMTVLENVMAGLHVKLRAGPFAAAFGLASVWRDEKDAADAAHAALAYVGADALAERDGGQLSFGQQRVVEIARALVSEPRVLLLDEPAVGLSPDRVTHLDALLRRIRDERGVTIVMIEHVIRLVVNVCDRITVMNLGRPIAEGTADEVTANAEVIEAYLDPPCMLSITALEVWDGTTEILRGVSFDVATDHVVALLGGNGAGKTTLLRTLSGIVKPRGGAITFDGETISGLPPRGVVARGLAQVPQGRFVWQGMTVLDNLLLGAVTRRDKPGIQASVADAFTLFPTLRRRQADRAGQLSGGEQQMLAIGRAMMAKPRMLLLDEPSAGLSPKYLGEMVEALRELHRRGLGMLLVEQNVGMAAALAGTAYVLANGAIAFETDGASLASNPQIIRSYLGQ